MNKSDYKARDRDSSVLSDEPKCYGLGEAGAISDLNDNVAFPGL
jgi:hypothetical protein